MELWNWQKHAGIHFEEVKDVNILKDRVLFILHFNEKANNRVGAYDTSGRLQQSVDGAIRFKVSEDSVLYVTIGENNGKCQLFRLDGKEKEPLYNSCREIKFLEIYPGQRGIIIYEQGNENGTVDIIFLDLKTKEAYPLEAVLPVNSRQQFIETIDGGNGYFLKVVVDYEKEDMSVVDIWYGNDYQLEKKFNPYPVYGFYIWRPEARQIEEIGVAFP